jgi:cobalt-zinc-cadmium efflux system membrane fusion protein
MNNRLATVIMTMILGCLSALYLAGCGETKGDPKAEAPPPAKVESQSENDVFTVDHPEQFPLVTAVEHKAPNSLNVTAVVTPDISRAVPVISIASGRIVDIKVRLGDQVKKGQLLLRVQSNDVSGAYQTYLKAVNDERLTRVQYERAKLLYEKGAIAKSALEAAVAAAQDAKVDLDTASEQLRLLGVDKDHPSGVVDITAPISGVITDQQVTNAAGVAGFGVGTPSPLTISDLSYVWIVCDVYENDLDAVHVGEYADIHLNAYPDKLIKGRIDNILAILDPNLRTAKVRIEVPNPGMLMRVGMFATATFYGRKPETFAAVPATAILHLHDRDWVYVPAGGQKIRRVQVTAGSIFPPNMQEVISGVRPGDQVIQNALMFENTVEQ